MTMKRKLIRVTKQDIELGWSGGSWSCPIARALRRAKLPAEVYIDTIEYEDGSLGSLPRRARQFSQKQELFSMFRNNPNSKAKALRVLKPFAFFVFDYEAKP